MPAIAAVLSLILGAVLSHVDLADWPWLRPWLFPGDATEARRLLLTIATAVLGALALVIGLTTVAIQVASNRYSPRLLRSFLRDRSVKVTMSMFVASFTFNAAGVFTVGDAGQTDYPRLPVTVGLVSIFACIASLLVFVDRMAHSIQIDTVLSRIGIATIETAERTPPGVGDGCGRRPPREDPPLWAHRVRADQNGYVQRVQRNDLRDIAAAGFNLRLAVRPGDHVVRGVTMGWIWTATPETDGPVPEGALRDAVWLGFERSRNQDIALGIDQIVDIALLSSHAYDFHTVVQAAEELAVLYERLARMSLGYETMVVDGRTVDMPGYTFAELLDRACGEMRRRAQAEPVIYRAMLTMLDQLVEVAERGFIRKAIRTQAELIQAAATRAGIEPNELETIAERTNEILAATRGGRAMSPQNA